MINISMIQAKQCHTRGPKIPAPARGCCLEGVVSAEGPGASDVLLPVGGTTGPGCPFPDRRGGRWHLSAGRDHCDRCRGRNRAINNLLQKLRLLRQLGLEEHVLLGELAVALVHRLQHLQHLVDVASQR